MNLKNILAAFILSLVISCTPPKFTPTKSESAIAQVEYAEQATANIYQSIIISKDKRFATYKPKYDSVAELITEIASYDSTRPKSKAILGIVKDIRDRFAKQITIHSTMDILNNYEAAILDDEMHDLWETLHNAEINYKSN